MTNENELKRYRDKAVTLHQEISRYSRIVAAKRKKASLASAVATKSKSQSTIRSKLHEADIATKDANIAESKRAGTEQKLADVEKKVSQVQQKYEKEQRNQLEKSLRSIGNSVTAANLQFGSSSRTPPSSSQLVSTPQINDIFLSHASEDKEEVAKPLQKALEQRGLSVWFDEVKIKVGHSIRQDIEDGITNARFGVVILSQHFFAKQWTQAELDALFSKKMDSGRPLLLPIWHRVTKDEVASRSPLLAGIKALNTATMTIDEIADALKEAVLP
jgi:hypothetical protein